MTRARPALARLLRPRAHDSSRFALPPVQPARPQCLVRATRTYAATTDSLPRVAQPSLWHSLVPKPFRSSRARALTWREWWAKDWNPATIFVVFGLVVGSNAINTLILRRDIADFSRKADAKIALLREVLEKVQRGEDVDVEGILGTGREESEAEWEEVLKEIEEEDRTWQARKRRKASAAEAREAAQPAAPTPSAPEPDSKAAAAKLDHVVPQERRGPVGFY